MLAVLALLGCLAAPVHAQTPSVPLGPGGGGGGGGGGGAVSSVSNGDGTLTISPTTGSVVGSLALAHANTWTATTGIGVQATGRAAFNLMNGPNGGSTVPVPTLYPATNNTNLAFDLSPHGVPTDLGYGVAWNDMCTTDQIQFGSSATACLHLSAGLNPSRLAIASAEYTAGTLLPLYFGTFNGDTPAYTDTFVINTDATYQELNGVAEQIRTVTAAGAVTVAKTDHVVCVNKTVGAATTANLFASPRTGTDIIIKDCKGDAATNNITVTPAAGNIDASGTFVINSNYGTWEGVYNGAAWSTAPSLSGGGGTPGGSSGQIQYNNSGSFGGFTLGGDCTFSVPNITCTALSGKAVTLSGPLTTTGPSAATTLAFGATGDTYTFPDASDTVVLLAATQSLSNKTFVGPILGAATGTSLALGGATLGANALAVTGTSSFSSTITFTAGSVNGSAVGSQYQLASDTIWSRHAAANWQSGAADAAAPVAQKLGVQSVIAGTSNTSGQNWTLNGSVSTGSGTSGDIILQTGGTGAAATVQNSEVAALTIKGATQRVVAAVSIGTGGFTVATLPATAAVGDRAYVTDQLTTCAAAGAALTGGGSIICPVFRNGTAWVGD